MLFYQIRPLAEKVRVRNAEQDTVIAFQITLGHNQRRLMAFSHARLVAENGALLPGRAQSESRRRNLVRVDLNVRRGVDRKQFLLVRQIFQRSRMAVGVERRHFHGFTFFPLKLRNLSLV